MDDWSPCCCAGCAQKTGSSEQEYKQELLADVHVLHAACHSVANCDCTEFGEILVKLLSWGSPGQVRKHLVVQFLVEQISIKGCISSDIVYIT